MNIKTRVARSAVFTVALSSAIALGAGPAYADDKVPNPPAKAPKEIQDKVDIIVGLLKWFGIAAVLVGIILAGIFMALGGGRGGGGRDGIERLGYAAGGAVIIGGASALVGFLL